MFGFPTPFHFGMPTFHFAAILSMCIVVMVTLVETSADILAVGEIIGTKVDSKRLGNGCVPTCCRACSRRSSARSPKAPSPRTSGWWR
jgi:xanthine/uracil permease